MRASMWIFKTDHVRILEHGEVDLYYFRNTPLLPEHELDITVASVVESGTSLADIKIL